MEHARIIFIFMISYCYITFIAFLTSRNYVELNNTIIITMIIVGTSHGIIVFCFKMNNKAVYSLLKGRVFRKESK
jgi:hypothetical protein